MHGVRELIASCPWLAEPDLEVCAVGSTALVEASRRATLPAPPQPNDIDLAWRLEIDAGRELLKQHGAEAQVTDSALGRGTVAAKIGRRRIEITSYRGGGGDAGSRIANDAARRDMTIGALYWRLADDAIIDPLGGLDDWRKARIRACGDAAERIDEHPIRALRYLRRACELGFFVESATRKAIRARAGQVATSVFPEALAEELRRVLATCESPGAFFQMCAEEVLLAEILPEVAPQFDGRPAGRLRWHAELSQSLHMVLALREAAAVAERDALDTATRVRLLLAVLCHDLGKGTTPGAEMPSHPGHEAAGVPLIEALFKRLPSLGSNRARRLCTVAARTHLLLVKLRRLKPGTLADLWERDLAPIRDDHALLAAVVRADRAGRLSPADLGVPRPPQVEAEEEPDDLETRLRTDLAELDDILRAVSGEESARMFPDDPSALRSHLRELRCDAIAAAGFLERRTKET